ncbi:retrovirus-related pol polyprotein from transposon RE1 [Citrus sinensis]|uniref:Retrovirus-related pol polyprotein from transposon RE1 n=1 Tax=Citrus sinensis TaxID=2711 RepID=A0ACB8N0X7_CITSI|nr:retrovirus-related pol polyprotein from transposon RE1 [Citrus sinensis]
MASSSLSTNVSSAISTFTFATPLKLDRSNYTIWKSQILSAIRANDLEGFLDGSRTCPNQLLPGESTSIEAAIISENSTYTAWKRQDQMILSWLLSSISVEILSIVVNSKTSRELWMSLEEQFGSETVAKKVHLKMLLNNLKKGSMTITEYFCKLRSVTDELAMAGSPVSSLDFVTHLISGLGQPYYPVVVYIEANVLKMSINEAYSMLLSHEARLESNHSSVAKETKLNFTANMAQTEEVMDLGEVALWNKTQGEASLEIKEDEVVLMEILVDIMEILVDLLEMVVLMVEIWDSLVVLVEENQGPRAAYVTTSEGVADQGWYLDSGATHHLTNNVQNLVEAKSEALETFKHFKLLVEKLFSLPVKTLQSDMGAEPTHSSSLPSHHMITKAKAGIFKPKSYLAATVDLEPASVKSALQDPKWFPAMKEEFDALQRNQTWTLVPSESAAKVVGNKWVYRVKYNPDGSISKYKARLVAKGYHQTQGVDFFETFSPVVKPCTVRVVLSLAVMHYWQIRQLDVNNAFLNGVLEEDVFMHQPQGFIDSAHPSYVCKLNKALYGLKQAPRAWYERLKGSLLNKGFQSSKSDTSLFLQHFGHDIVLILIYVDDILVTGSNSHHIEAVIQYLHSEFALKDLGEFNYFLGIEVTPSVQGLHLSQTKYIGDILSKANMLDSKGFNTLMSPGDKLKKNSGAAFDNPSLYRSIVGSLQYVLLTRPNIAYPVNKLSQFLAHPTISHWQACKRVLRYLQSTSHFGIQFFNSGSETLTAFSDADWAADPDDRKSTGGYCVFLGSNIISWSSKKQTIVSHSSAESEYRALASATSEILWLTYLLQELRIQLDHSPVMYCDNQSAEALASNPKYHSRTKHIELDLHFIREHVAKKQLTVSHVSSSEQVADILTKPLFFYQFAYLRTKLNILPRA